MKISSNKSYITYISHPVLSFIGILNSSVSIYIIQTSLKINLDSLSIHRNIAIDMGTTKSEIFTEKQNRLAGMLKALAHPARIAILEQLLKMETCVCGTLVNELGLAQATISQHLKELKNAGLIQGTIEGTSVCYCIDPSVWKLFKKELEYFFVPLAEKKNCC